MNISIIMLLIIILFILNKILDVCNKRLEVKMEKSKNSRIIPGLNSLYISTFNEFKDKIFDFLDYRFEEVELYEEEYFLIRDLGIKKLIYIRQTKEFSQIIDEDEFYLLIAKAMEIEVQEVTLITNGKVRINEENLLDTDILKINYIDGEDLVENLLEMKKEKIMNGEM
ncbi:MAG: hypothetical protein ACRC57_11355 [Sarcina sp.]